MDYWNEENFEGLKSIYQYYIDKPVYKYFAEYCLFKEKGLRKKAIESINKFIEELKLKNIYEQREIAVELTKLSYYNSRIHQLLSYPIHQSLQEIFKRWCSEDKINYIPFCWMGYLSRDITYFEKSFELNKNDIITVRALINKRLDSVDFQTHHIGESYFIGEISIALKLLEEVLFYLEYIPQNEEKIFFLKEYNYYKKLVELWIEYSKEKSQIQFSEWCESKNEVFNFGKCFYYNIE